jgi:predicted DCC family thiol-disulfide oxidoreductase YuxK
LSATYESERTIELTHDSDNDGWVVYDGECPFCSRYVLLYQLRERGQRVHLIDARSSDPIVGEVRARNLDLNEGMVVRWRGQYYYGAEAMHLLAKLAGDGSFFNRVNRLLFSRSRLARALYPALVRGRKLTLRLLGRKLIGEI